jgi:hypothetical protein
MTLLLSTVLHCNSTTAHLLELHSMYGCCIYRYLSQHGTAAAIMHLLQLHDVDAAQPRLQLDLTQHLNPFYTATTLPPTCFSSTMFTWLSRACSWISHNKTSTPATLQPHCSAPASAPRCSHGSAAPAAGSPSVPSQDLALAPGHCRQQRQQQRQQRTAARS